MNCNLLTLAHQGETKPAFLLSLALILNVGFDLNCSDILLKRLRSPVDGDLLIASPVPFSPVGQGQVRDASLGDDEVLHRERRLLPRLWLSDSLGRCGLFAILVVDALLFNHKTLLFQKGGYSSTVALEQLKRPLSGLPGVPQVLGDVLKFFILHRLSQGVCVRSVQRLDLSILFPGHVRAHYLRKLPLVEHGLSFRVFCPANWQRLSQIRPSASVDRVHIKLLLCWSHRVRHCYASQRPRSCSILLC